MMGDHLKSGAGIESGASRTYYLAMIFQETPVFTKLIQ